MKVLVTGASGFIGRSLTKRLNDEGFLVRVISRSNSKVLFDNVEVVVGDLASGEDDLSNIAVGCDVIFHCAGEINDPLKMYALHVAGTNKLIAAVKKSIQLDGRPKHLIQLSSVGAYGTSIKPNQSRVVTECSDCNPIGEYEVTKTLSDEIVINAAKDSNLTYTILRPSNVVGFLMPNQSFKSLLSAIKRRQFFFIGSRESISTYIHVDDVVDALIQCAKDKRAQNQIFNLSKDCNLSDIVSAVSHSYGFKPNFLCIPEWLLRSFVSLSSNIFRLPLTNARIDALVSKTTYPTIKIEGALGFSPSRSIPEFAVEYLARLNNE
jgi:nucleoside-diphosphate-sugar epimerase